MNLKRLLLLPGALALVLAYAPTLPVFAQTPSSAPTGQYQKHRLNLNLTDDQKAQLKQIHESTRSQIDAVLTPDQRAQLANAKGQRQQGQQGQKPREVWSSLNLTADQKAKIRAIREDAKQKSDAVLTAEQRQQLQQQRQQWQQNRRSPQTPQQPPQ